MEKKKRRNWEQEEDHYLIANYSDAPIDVIMARLGDRTYYAIINRVRILKLKRSKAYMQGLASDKMQQAGKETRFKKGGKSWNRGTKGLTKANKTSFKKRSRPHNWKPIGSERITSAGYIEVKYKDEYNAVSNYELKQRLIWMKYNGPIPNGYVVTFKDGNTSNFDIENLDLMSKKDSMLKNNMSDATIAKRYLGYRGSEIEQILPYIQMKRAQLQLNNKLKIYEQSRDKI